MTDYKSNSDKTRVVVEEEKKIESIVKGSIVKKRGSVVEKMAGLFLAQNPDEAYDDIVRDIVIPAIKNVFIDSLNTLLNGKPTRSRTGTTASRVSYRDFYDKESERDKLRYSSRQSDAIAYDDVIFESVGDAEIVLDAMEDAIEQYGRISVSDYYDLSGVEVTTRDYPAGKYGWKNISGSKAVRVKEGWIIKLPRAYPIY